MPKIFMFESIFEITIIDRSVPDACKYFQIFEFSSFFSILKICRVVPHIAYSTNFVGIIVENLETDSCNFKNRFKHENFRRFWRFPSILKHSTKLFLFFRYTVHSQGHVGALFKKIQVEKFFIKIIESPLIISHCY